MIKEITITVEAKDEKNPGLHDNLIRKELKKNHINAGQFEKVFVKKSIDARHGQLKLHLRYKVYIGEKPESAGEWKPAWKSAAGADKDHTVIIVGSGPAGLFGALKLLEKGIKPLIIERGVESSQRRKDIALISTKGLVNGDSNYCFGEGGAGTFSDGKLFILNYKINYSCIKIKLAAKLNYFCPHGINNLRQSVCSNMRVSIGQDFFVCTKIIKYSENTSYVTPLITSGIKFSV